MLSLPCVLIHMEKLEARGYTCALDPDLDFETLTLEPEQFPDYEPPYVEPVPVPTTLDPATLGSGLTLSNGNMTVENVGGTDDSVVRSTDSHTTGKVYWEARLDVLTENTGWCEFGLSEADTILAYRDYPGSGLSSLWFLYGTIRLG